MGRGRAKAKQTKVARELKYNSGGMDLDRLRADLIHESNSDVDPELLQKYSDLADDDSGEDEDEDYASYR
jgi:hypothetical protein